MIKFFRHIRRSLINQNKMGNPALLAGRYIKYAIGEIVLVVIGILIALQINNWNEERKEKESLNAIYNLVISDLDVKNNLNWVLDEIKLEIDKLKPTPSPSKEGKNTAI